jgi:hypothetical protein
VPSKDIKLFYFDQTEIIFHLSTSHELVIALIKVFFMLGFLSRPRRCAVSGIINTFILSQNWPPRKALSMSFDCLPMMKVFLCWNSWDRYDYCRRWNIINILFLIKLKKLFSISKTWKLVIACDKVFFLCWRFLSRYKVCRQRDGIKLLFLIKTEIFFQITKHVLVIACNKKFF